MTTEDNALPELADDRVDVIEQRLFAQIAEERSAVAEGGETERAPCAADVSGWAVPPQRRWSRSPRSSHRPCCTHSPFLARRL
jgi:hypothetical protein